MNRPRDEQETSGGALPLNYPAQLAPPRQAVLQEVDGRLVLILPRKYRLLMLLSVIPFGLAGVGFSVAGVMYLSLLARVGVFLSEVWPQALLTLVWLFGAAIMSLLTFVWFIVWNYRFGHLPERFELDDALHHLWPGWRGPRWRSWRLDQIKSVRWVQLTSLLPGRDVYEMRISFHRRLPLVRRFHGREREAGEKFARRLQELPQQNRTKR